MAPGATSDPTGRSVSITAPDGMEIPLSCEVATLTPAVEEIRLTSHILLYNGLYRR